MLFLFEIFSYSSLIEPPLSIFDELKTAGLGINICPVISKRYPSLHSFYFDRHSSRKTTNGTLTMDSPLLLTCGLYEVNHKGNPSRHTFYFDRHSSRKNTNNTLTMDSPLLS